MTIDEAIEAYQQLSPKIFKKRWCAQSKASRYTGAELNDYWFEGKNLKDAVQNLLQDRKLDPDMKLLESENPDCRVSVSTKCNNSAQKAQGCHLVLYVRPALFPLKLNCFVRINREDSGIETTIASGRKLCGRHQRHHCSSNL